MVYYFNRYNSKRGHYMKRTLVKILSSRRILLCLILFFTVCPFNIHTAAAGDETRPETSVLQQMQTRPLGKTGKEIPLFSLGGASIGRQGNFQKEIDVINRAIDMGVKYIDTSPRYVGGLSERYIGHVMKTRRNEVFLADKCHDFTYDGAMRLVQRSLRNLQTDHLDLYLHHGVFNENQLEEVTSERGALKAFLELKEKKVVNYIGMSSHSPKILLKALDLGVYDCMVVTLNPAGDAMLDRPYLDEFMKKAAEKGVGVIAIHTAGGGKLLRYGVRMEDLLRYALSYPVTTAVVSVSEIWHVEENVMSAANFKSMTVEEKSKLENIFSPKK